jgi:hypothetical protein
MRKGKKWRRIHENRACLTLLLEPIGTSVLVTKEIPGVIFGPFKTACPGKKQGGAQ